MCRALFVWLLVAGPEAPAPKPVWVTHGESTFIDDPFALSPSGDRLAYVRTNGADVAQVEVVGLPGGRTESTFSIVKFTHTAERLGFTADGKQLVVVARADDKRDAQVFELNGKQVGRKIGPVEQIALTQVEGKPALVTLSSKTTSGGTTYEVVALRTDGKSVGRRSLTVGKDGLAKVGEGFKIVYWYDDFLRLMGQKKGEYDKKNDVRRPDRAMVWDVLKGKPAGEHEIGDVVAWVRAIKDRASHPNTAAFVQYTEDLKTVELLTPDGARHPLELARPTYKYEPKSLLQQVGPEPNRLYLSLTVDPVNAEAVKAKKADIDIFDLYTVDGESAKATRVLTGLRADKRALAWIAAGGRVAILHKHKGFDRGGMDLEVYDIAR